MIFRTLKPQRPTVIRKGNVVHLCHYYNGTKQCLGPRCLWIQVGTCKFHKRAKGNFAAQ
jgi:hypothetical protein